MFRSLLRTLQSAQRDPASVLLPRISDLPFGAPPFDTPTIDRLLVNYVHKRQAGHDK